MGSMMFLLSVTLLIFGSVASYDWTSKSNLREFLIPSKDVVDDRIVGGYRASIEDHPYQVSMMTNGSGLCGGFIVSENYIVTAAHCVRDVDISDIIVRAGSNWRTNGTVIPIAEIISNPEYDDPAYDKDVAVLRTEDPIEFNDVIQPIVLPAKGRRMISNSKVTVSGWGRTTFGASATPQHLRAVTITVVNHDFCGLLYQTLTDNQWCGGNFVFGGKGACKGDSGGPAVQNGMVVGIVSYSRGCAMPGSPTVFADVAAPVIRDYITKHTGL